MPPGCGANAAASKQLQGLLRAISRQATGDGAGCREGLWQRVTDRKRDTVTEAWSRSFRHGSSIPASGNPEYCPGRASRASRHGAAEPSPAPACIRLRLRRSRAPKAGLAAARCARQFRETRVRAVAWGIEIGVDENAPRISARSRSRSFRSDAPVCSIRAVPCGCKQRRDKHTKAAGEERPRVLCQRPGS